MLAAVTAFLAMMGSGIAGYVMKYGLGLLVRFGPFATACLLGWLLYDISGTWTKALVIVALVAAFVTGFDVRGALPTSLALGTPPAKDA